MSRGLIGRFLAWTLRGAIIAGLVAAAVGGFAAYRVWQQGELDEERPADAIVVLGAAQYDGRPSPVFRARLDHAVALYHEGVAPFLVVTGGRQPGDRTTEAAVARRYAVANGVPTPVPSASLTPVCWKSALTPVSGLNIQRQTTPVVMKEIA